MWAALSNAVALAQTPASPAAEKSKDINQRLRHAELIFFARFSKERVKATISRLYEVPLENLRAKGDEEEVINRIEFLLDALATEIANSDSFKEQISTWLATEFDVDELREYYRFLLSPLGKKVLDFEFRLLPLLAETGRRLDKGRSEEIVGLLRGAMQRQRDGSSKADTTAGAQRAKPPPPPFQHVAPTPR